MNDFVTTFHKDLISITKSLINNSVVNKNLDTSIISVDYSSKSKKGHLSSNVFIILNNFLKDKNFKLKIFIINKIKDLDYIDNVEIANAGFLNVILKKEFLLNKLFDSLDQKKNYGKLNVENQKKINIEFVSANPTGPLHLAHIRGAVYGDVLANILIATGNNVTKEYYVNNTGSQINILGTSFFKRYQELNNIKNIIIKDNEYPGEYLIDLAKKVQINDGDKWLNENESKRNHYFQNFAKKEILKSIIDDLKKIDINFDKFTFESDIIKSNKIHEVFEILKKENLLYEGLLPKPKSEDLSDWEPRKQLLFRSSKFSDDFDRPFQKSNGEWTYFANDSAYHYDKILRNYDQLINIWGSDHIGYISRMKSIVEVISKKKNFLQIKVCQIVRLFKDKKIIKMSKREGNIITLNELLKQVNKDSLRYFMISTKNETPIDFDIIRVIEKNKDNPVFYCQYAYARASSIVEKSNKFIKDKNLLNSKNKFNISALSEDEWNIILKIISWPYLLKQSSNLQQPHKITNYLEDLSSSFHSFWNKGKDNQSLRIIDESNEINTITKLISTIFILLASL